MLEDVKYAHVSFGINRNARQLRRISGLGFSYTRVGSGDLEARDASGGKAGSFTYQDSAFGLSGSMSLTRQLNLGVTAKGIQSEIAGYKSNRAWAFDLGMSYNMQVVKRPLALGLGLSNLGQKVGFINQMDSLPAAMNLGASTSFGALTAMAGLNRGLYDGQTALSLGLETHLGPVSLRAGYRSDSGLGGRGSSASGQSGASGMLSGFAAGMGLHIRSLRLDYALGQETQDLGLSQRASITFQFGKSVK